MFKELYSGYPEFMEASEMLEQRIRGKWEEMLEKGIAQGLAQGMEQGLAQGREQGIEQGREQGLEQGKVEIAKAMLLDGLPAGQVIKITGLGPAQIQLLKEQIL